MCGDGLKHSRRTQQLCIWCSVFFLLLTKNYALRIPNENLNGRIDPAGHHWIKQTLRQLKYITRKNEREYWTWELLGERASYDDARNENQH